jgi:WD40 repeat protein
MKIVSYVNVAYEPTVANPVLLWHGDTQHDDDILCCDSYNTLLATGSYDGQIKIWSIETQRLFSCLQNAYPEIRIDSRDPVEKLLFLKHRASVEFNSCVLVSSERGFLKFWKLQAKNHEHLCAKFYASAFGEQAVLSITTDPENKILITGDTLGLSI